jgi:hypothetical protein
MREKVGRFVGFRIEQHSGCRPEIVPGTALNTWCSWRGETDGKRGRSSIRIRARSDDSDDLGFESSESSDLEVL